MNFSDLESRLIKSVDFLKSELNQIRTGRVSPSLIENVSVEAYGSQMTIKELGSIMVLDNQNLVVTPWDKGLLKAISKKIMESGLGLNPVEESDRIRVPIPPLTEDRRKEFTKLVSTKVEECKNSLRSIRQDFMKIVDKDFADKLIGEDEKFKQREKIEEVVRKYVSQADEIGEEKNKALMTI